MDYLIEKKRWSCKHRELTSHISTATCHQHAKCPKQEEGACRRCTSRRPLARPHAHAQTPHLPRLRVPNSRLAW